MKKYLTILILFFSFTASAQIIYTPMSAGGYQMKYLKVDSGFALPFRDTTIGRGINRPGLLVVNTKDSILYIFNGKKWTPAYVDSTGVIGLIKNKVDSVTLSGNNLFYWSKGIGYGSQLNKLDSIYMRNDSVYTCIAGNCTFRYISSGPDSLAHRTWVQASDSSYLGVKNLKNNVDTLVVLAPDGAIAGGGGGNTDTTSLSNRINNKWDLNGNAGTNPANNFIGTTDNQPLIFKTNNILAGYVSQISYNVSLGDNSLPYSTTAFADNSNIGHNGLRFNTTGSANSNLGAYGLLHNTTGSLNNNLGTSGLFNNTTGSFNNSLGSTSLYNNNGNYNTALGDSSLYNNTTGNYNIGLGHKSGINQTTASNTLYISDSTYHGYWELDSASGTAPSVIGKDANGYWHTYQTPIRPYRVYTALLSQTGTSAPTATVLENTLGVTVTFSYVSTGRYTANISTTLFAPNKTFVVIQNTPYTNINYAEAAVASASNYIDIWVRTPSTGSLVNGLYNASFEIRVYN